MKEKERKIYHILTKGKKKENRKRGGKEMKESRKEKRRKKVRRRKERKGIKSGKTCHVLTHGKGKRK